MITPELAHDNAALGFMTPSRNQSLYRLLCRSCVPLFANILASLLVRRHSQSSIATVVQHAKSTLMQYSTSAELVTLTHSTH